VYFASQQDAILLELKGRSNLGKEQAKKFFTEVFAWFLPWGGNRLVNFTLEKS
jgi:hypothetical protein